MALKVNKQFLSSVTNLQLTPELKQLQIELKKQASKAHRMD